MLRRLVTILTFVMIGGIMIIAVTLALRLSSAQGGGDAISGFQAEEITLPAGEEIIAASAGEGAVTIVTKDAEGREWLRVFDPESGEEAGAAKINRATE